MNKSSPWTLPHNPTSAKGAQATRPLSEKDNVETELKGLLNYLTRQYSPFDEMLDLPSNGHYRWQWVRAYSLDSMRDLFAVVEQQQLRNSSQEQAFALQEEATLILSDWAASDEQRWLELVQEQLNENPSESSLALIMGAASHYTSASTLTQTLAAPIATAVWPLRTTLSKENLESLAELLAACEPNFARKKLLQLKEIKDDCLT